MPKRKYQPQKDTDILSASESRLPVERPIAVYYRQSTDAQVGNISTSLQTVDMVAYLRERGWSEDKILMIDMDAGISGTKKIDERPGMSALFRLVTEGRIGAVACQDEDRLFRDVTQIQVNIFIEACRAANVLVITPSMVYDFANEMTGTFHARQFRFKSEMAAEYINAVIRGKLHRSKRRMLMDGYWAGSGMPPGFMVDLRKVLPDGSKNPDWRRYVPFEPYAEVVQEYFRLFLAHAGNVRATVKEIQEKGPFYPDPETCQPPEGYRVLYRMHRYGKGYCPGRTGLVGLLTNAAYIGHWSVNDVIVRWNNHPAIVPVDTFMKAYNYLSEVTLDGKENSSYLNRQQNSRPSLDETRNVERPLCAGMLFSEDAGVWRTVGTNWVGSLQHYTYVLWGAPPKDRYIWGKKADEVDNAITALVRSKLSITFDREVWSKTLEVFIHEQDQAQQLMLSQIEGLERVMENLIAGLETLTNPDMIRAAQARYEDAKAEYERLSTEITAIDKETNQLQELVRLKDEYGPALENWDQMTRDEKLVIFHAFISRIEAYSVADHGLRLIVRWRDNSTDEVSLGRTATNGKPWSPRDTARLLELIDASAPQIEIASEFPDRKWSLIRNKAWSLRGRGVLQPRPKPIKDQESYWEYVERVGEEPVDSMDSVTCSGTARRGGPGRSRRGGASCRPRPARHARWCGAEPGKAGFESAGCLEEAGLRQSRSW
jgi:DNA invertase Pin-like site-specific DNA recombinase